MKILIVDDKEENLCLLETLLKGSGYEVVSAANGVEALEKLRGRGFDMIISDILMPVVDGFQLCRKVKGDDELRDIPFIFYTATYTDEKDEEFALKLGADRFIRKPAEPDDLVKILQGMLKDVGKGKIRPKQPSFEEEKEIFKLYSERLVKKLEQKMLDLEREIAERVRAEEALRRSEEEYRGIFESATDTFLIFNLEGEIVEANPAACEMYGYPYEEFIGLSGKDIVHPDYYHLFEDFKKQVKSAGRFHAESVDVRKDGNTFNIEVRGAPFNYQGELHLLAVVRDITERKRAEENLQLSFEKLQRTLEGTVHALAATVEMRDPYTSGHQQRVTELACAVAKEMDLSEKQIEGLHLAGLIHDIGKINVPAEILSKPSRLTGTEFSLIKGHSQAGYEILKGIDFPGPVAQIVLQHHERMDGSGYPQGLSGEEILLEARILTVADVVEAMASHRPYRAACGLEAALEEITRVKGTKYDSGVVNACLRLFREEGFEFMKEM